MQQPCRDGTPLAALTNGVPARSDFSDCDLLDLNGTDVRSIVQNTSDPDSSLVTYHNDSSLRFAQIARIIPCFTADTLIATPRGERRAQDLRLGDKVLTRDNGIQTITWAGHKTMTMRNIAVTDDMRPIRISKGAFGPNCPERDMIVSPNHRILIGTGSEVLAAAKDLIHLPGISALRSDMVTYIHFMCAQHEIVFSDGLWTETFQPNDHALHGIDAAQRAELFALFPELTKVDGRHAYGTARPVVTKQGLLAA